MEQISRQQDHVNITLSGQTHDLMEGLPTVVPADGVSFIVPDMVVS